MGGRAVVLGASIAGLLTAAALAGAYEEVVVVDRDVLPDEVGSAPRRGVPHGQHAHGLLGGGLRAIEELLPGATDDLVARGVPYGDISANVRFCPSGRRFRQVEVGQRALGPSRPYLESYLRHRVRALLGVRILDGADVVGLVADEDKRVIGARVHRASAGAAEVLDAELVVDATGRGSRMPIWLEELGFEKAPEERLRVDLTYTTRHYRIAREELHGDLALIIAPTVDHPRGGVAQVQEGGRTIVTLFGFMGDSAPGDALVEFARTLPLPDVYDVIKDATPLDEPIEFKFPASVRRRYERLRSFPAGLLVIGDAICSFNPLYGQGMSVAAMEALALRGMLDGGVDALRFFRAAAPLVDVPWQIVVGGDMAFPQVEGELTGMVRFINAYLGRLHVAAERDASLAVAFVRVANLLASPASLLRPDRAARVLARGRAKAATA